MEKAIVMAEKGWANYILTKLLRRHSGSYSHIITPCFFQMLLHTSVGGIKILNQPFNFFEFYVT